ncbi:solute carrier family 45 member 4-like [Lineus longissimus]|uniref:solute carrier family 45 member 4-like n=1 Tax=Lineus longissimus TaxID=88925 RepID=UPI00315CC32B
MTDEKVQLVKTKDDDSIPEVVKKYPHAYRRKTRWELLRMCIGVVGIDFCYAAETAFVSPTMLKLHVPVTFMTWVWVTPPILGLICNPLLGSLSDRCRSRLGRRRPFILSMTVGVLLGLLLLPNGYSLGQLLGDKCNPFQADGNSNCLSNNSHFDGIQINANGAETSRGLTLGSTENESNSIGNNSMLLLDNPSTIDTECELNLICPIGIALTVIGLLLMDFSCDGSQSPFRTYVIDLCTEEDQVRGLTTFTIVSGIGGCAGYAIGGVDWESVTGSYSFITQLRVVFGVALGLHLICVLFAVTSFGEIPLDDLQAGSDDEGLDREEPKLALDNTEAGNGGHRLDYGAVPDRPTEKAKNSNEHGNSRTSFLTYAKSIICLPKCVAWVCVSNFFLWMSIVTWALYFTDFVGQAVYHGSPSAPDGSVESNLYNDGVRLGSIALAMYAATSSIYSLFIERLVGRFGTRVVYMIGPVASIIGAVIIASVRIVPVVLVFSPTIGITYATLFTLPYIVTTKYHEQGMFNDAAGKSSRGLGTDVALVTSMLFLAQIVISLCMGAMIHATGSTITIPVTSAITGSIGVILSSQITHLDQTEN